MALYQSAGIVGRLANVIAALLRFPHNMALACLELQGDMLRLWVMKMREQFR
jgi:hypothetical protein